MAENIRELLKAEENIRVSLPATKDDTRKVAWRALLGGLIPQSEPFLQTGVLPQGTGETPTHRRLGKLNDHAYDNWEGFLKIASDKMGVDLLRSPRIDNENERKKMENRFHVLHTLRCLLGQLVESMILLDRLLFLQEQLNNEMEVELVNLFDQATGSGRNVAIVVKPRDNNNLLIP